MAAKTSVKASLPSVHYKLYPFLGLCIPQAILDDSTFVIAITNVTFYYSTTLASVYASSTRRVICIICRILALYSENAAETISKGLKSKFFQVYSPYLPYVRATHTFMCCWKPPLQISAYAPVHTQHTHTHTHTNIYTPKNIDNAHTHKYTHKHTHAHTNTHTHTLKQPIHVSTWWRAIATCHYVASCMVTSCLVVA